MTKGSLRGFTLIELSIVLIIIGLIVGGVLVGQNLIAAATVRAQITQIEKFNQAANTFRGKYGYLPGDIKDPDASSFGLKARGIYAGQGDGNGLIEGSYENAVGGNSGDMIGCGEAVMVWGDLAKTGLIEGGFTTASPNVQLNIPLASLPLYFPAAKIGNGNFVSVFSGGYKGGDYRVSDNSNYWGISVLSSVGGFGSTPVATPGITVAQAWSIDQKIDDGLPQSGRVLAIYLSGTNTVYWAGSGQYSNGLYPVAPWTTATTGSSTTCFDNAGGSGPQQYSLQQNNGSGVNCALSFRMQAGD